MRESGAGGGGLIRKTDFQTGGLIERVFNRDVVYLTTSSLQLSNKAFNP